MATKKVTEIVSSKPKKPRLSGADFLDDVSPLDEVERAMAALPAEDTALYLYRVRPEGRPLFLTKLSPGQFDLSPIQERWGGGSYKVVSVDTLTDDRQEREFEIAGPAKDGGVTPVNSGQVNIPLPPLPPGTPIETRLDRLERMLFQFAQGQNGGGLSEALLAKLIESSGRSEDKILERLATYKSFFASPSASQTTLDVQSLIAMFKEGLSAANGEPVSPWLSIIERVLPTIQEVLAKLPNGAGVAVRTRPQISQPGGGQTVVEQPKLSGFLAQIEPMIRPHIATFVVAAAADDDPGLLVPLVARRIPDDRKAQALEWLKGPEWFNQLSQLDSRIALQGAWWNEFAAQLRAELGEPQEAQDEVS